MSNNIDFSPQDLTNKIQAAYNNPDDSAELLRDVLLELIESTAETVENVNEVTSNAALGEADDPNAPEVNPATGEVTDPNANILWYLYRFLDIRFADDNQGTNFTTTHGGRTFYGLRNTMSSTTSSNPADYVWRQFNGQQPQYLVYGGGQVELIFDNDVQTGFTSIIGTNNRIDLRTVSSVTSTNIGRLDFTSPFIIIANASGVPLSLSTATTDVSVIVDNVNRTADYDITITASTGITAAIDSSNNIAISAITAATSAGTITISAVPSSGMTLPSLTGVIRVAKQNLVAGVNARSFDFSTDLTQVTITYSDGTTSAPFNVSHLSDQITTIENDIATRATNTDLNALVASIYNNVTDYDSTVTYANNAIVRFNNMVYQNQTGGNIAPGGVSPGTVGGPWTLVSNTPFFGLQSAFIDSIMLDVDQIANAATATSVTALQTSVGDNATAITSVTQNVEAKIGSPTTAFYGIRAAAGDNNAAEITLTSFDNLGNPTTSISEIQLRADNVSIVGNLVLTQAPGNRVNLEYGGTTVGSFTPPHDLIAYIAEDSKPPVPVGTSAVIPPAHMIPGADVPNFDILSQLTSVDLEWAPTGTLFNNDWFVSTAPVTTTNPSAVLAGKLGGLNSTAPPPNSSWDNANWFLIDVPPTHNQFFDPIVIGDTLIFASANATQSTGSWAVVRVAGHIDTGSDNLFASMELINSFGSIPEDITVYTARGASGFDNDNILEAGFVSVPWSFDPPENTTDPVWASRNRSDRVENQAWSAVTLWRSPPTESFNVIVGGPAIIDVDDQVVERTILHAYLGSVDVVEMIPSDEFCWVRVNSDGTEDLITTGRTVQLSTSSLGFDNAVDTTSSSIDIRVDQEILNQLR